MKYKYILGIQCFATMDSGACIIRYKYNSTKYEYIAISEERLIRKKYPYTFPIHSIKYCMDYFKIKSLDKVNLLVSDIIRENTWRRSGPSYNVKEFDYIKEKLKIENKKIIQINHHLAHAASAYYTSGFKDSAILIVDGNGTDLETNSFFYGNKSNIKLIDKYKARGIGAVYNYITSKCLNLGKGGEGKTMGLAPYGKKGKKIIDFSKVVLNGIETDYSSIMKRMPFTDIISFNKKINISQSVLKLPKRKIGENITNKYWSKIAYDLQEEAERCLVHLGKEIYKETKSRNICIAGGVALNSVANQKIFDKTNFKDIFVYPACSDAGVPFGLAIWGLYNHPNTIKIKPKIKKLNNAYTGKKYNTEYIEKFLNKYKIKFSKLNLYKIAKKISEGKIIAWFQGGSEYGPRALGNRSILADSRNPKMQDIINIRIKHRESYRPFAPAVLEEDYKKFFLLKNPSPFMLLVAKVKNKKKLPAITHVDGTARVQTVSRKQNKIFYNLIKEFKSITGIGCVLNTSFNDNGEPIVETPEDAFLTFLSTDMDYLVLGNRVIDAKKLDRSIGKKISREREKNIKKNEKNAMKILTSGYNRHEKNKYFIQKSKDAVWNALEKPVVDLKNKINYWIKDNKKILIYGTYDHTKFIINNIKEFNKLNIIGFVPYKIYNEEFNSKKKILLPFKEYKKIEKHLNNFEILISSYEFSYDIERYLNKKFSKIKNFKIYTGYSRSILNYFDTKKRI